MAGCTPQWHAGAVHTATMLVGSLGAGRAGEQLDLGPDHPSRTGLVAITCEHEEGVIVRAHVESGLLHRAAEKLFEVRDYHQILMLADRHDWHASFTGELGAAQLFERVLRLSVPERGQWLRMIGAELARIGSHLAFFSYVHHGVLDADGRGHNVTLREQLRSLQRHLTGNRVHPMYTRLGGVSHDMPLEWDLSARAFTAAVSAYAHETEDAIQSGPFAELSRGVAVIHPNQLEPLGLTGPVAKGSGAGVDLRLARPYLRYAALDIDLDPGVTGGDAQARLLVLARELAISASIVEHCLDALADLPGPVGTRLPKIVRLPECDEYLDLEGPLGWAGFHLISRGEKTPWRLKLRTPSFANVAALEHVLPGTTLDQLTVALASIGWVSGDLDK